MPRKQTLKLLVQDETGAMEVVFFHAGFLEKSLKQNEEYLLYGKASVNMGRTQMLHPDISKYEPDQEQSILPVYPLTGGVSQGEMRKWERAALELLPELTEYLPEKTIERNRLCGLQYAIENIHYPQDRKKTHGSEIQTHLRRAAFFADRAVGNQKEDVCKRAGDPFFPLR